jgi:hypothetical protein
MTRFTVIGGLVAVLAIVVLAGCSAQLGDRGGDEGSPPDRIGDVDFIEVFRNADNFPNIARMCVDGLAFAGTSSGLRGEDAVANPALLRIPEWDPTCVGRTFSAPPPGDG